MPVMTIHDNFGFCPICGVTMEPAGDEVVGSYINAHYACNQCEVDVTYAAPNDHRAWEEYADSEIEIQLVPFAS